MKRAPVERAPREPDQKRILKNGFTQVGGAEDSLARRVMMFAEAIAEALFETVTFDLSRYHHDPGGKEWVFETRDLVSQFFFVA